MVMPIAGISQFILGLILLIAWVFIHYHSHRSEVPVLKSVSYLKKYFLYFAIFNFTLSAPHIILFIAPEAFSVTMAWGYSIAHIFVFVALAYLSRLAVSLIPRIARYERAVFVGWLIATALITGLNTMFATLQNQPTFDFATGLTQFHIPQFIGIIFGNASLLGYIPLITLFAISALRSFGTKRRRVLLLTFGMAITMIAGPLHAVARNWQTYVIADIFNALGLILVAIGIIYQLDERVSAKPSGAVGSDTKTM